MGPRDEAFGYDGQFWGDSLELAFWIMGEEEAERRFGGRVIRMGEKEG